LCPSRGVEVRLLSAALWSPANLTIPREDLGVTLGEPLDRDVGSPTALRNGK
jgi:hypothetical protein